MKVTSILSILAIAATPAICLAGDWSGTGDLGYNSVSGNSDSESLALGLNAAYETGRWTHAGDFDAFSASQDGATNAKSYDLKLQSDYAWKENHFAFGKLRYLDDRFSGYDYQSSVTFGAGRTFLENGNNLFSAQIGAGYRTSELRDSGDSENEPVVTAGITYNRDVTETTVFESAWSAESGSDNTYLEGSVALIVSMTDALGIKLSYVAKHNTDVPAGSKNTDRFTTVSLNYKFK